VPGESELYSKFGRTVEPGKVIFKEGDGSQEMFIIQSGKVKVTRLIGGKEQVLAILGKGDFFGEMGMVTGVTRTATVQALERVELLSFGREGFLDLINKNPRIALHLIEKLCRRLQRANLHIKHLARKDARGLISLNLINMYQGESPDQASLSLTRTVEEISDSLELSLEQVRAVLEELAAFGILSQEGDTLRLLEAEKLGDLAEHLGG